MKLRTDVFVRHAEGESLVAAPRRGGSLVLQGAEVFLEAIPRGAAPGVTVEAIVERVAAVFGCPVAEVAADVHDFVALLAREGYLEGMESPAAGVSAGTQAATVAAEAEPEDEETALGDFYRRHGLPAELHLDLTDGCNERCVHCYLPSGRAHFIERELAFKVLGEFRAAGGITVMISGGECLLHPEFEAIVREARRLELNIILLSNLTRCTAQTVALLREVQPQFVNVSLYAAQAEVHDAITRLAGSWKKTVWAIDALLAAGVPVRLATPLMRPNRHAVAGLQAFARERGVHVIFDCDIFGRMDHDCSNQAVALTLAELEVLLREHGAALLHPPAPAARCACEAKVCDIGDARLNVNAQGDYYPCDGFHGMVLGNAHRDTLEAVWRGEKLNALRAWRNRDFGACGTCANRAWCKVCAMRNFNETGDCLTHAPVRCAVAALKRQVALGAKGV